MGLLIAQGYAAGLFSEGTQIIASDAGLSASVWAMMPPSEVTKMMKGVLVFSPTSGYASPQASKFLKAYLVKATQSKIHLLAYVMTELTTVAESIGIFSKRPLI